MTTESQNTSACGETAGVGTGDLLALLQKLRIADGDALVIRGEHAPQTLSELTRRLRERGMKNILCVLLKDGQSIEALNEDEMRAHGWVRANVGDVPRAGNGHAPKE